MTQIAIIIPARYHSSRLPGKPLVPIAEIPMIQRVWQIAQVAMSLSLEAHPGVNIRSYVTTEDQRIVDQCRLWNMECLLTSDQCRSGTERVARASQEMNSPPDFIINLQGDNALCPPWFVTAMIDTFVEKQVQGVITPFVQLEWSALDQLRQEKAKTPFSGTCVVMNQQQRALWFSKNIIPAIRDEALRKDQGSLSPIRRHIGLYGYDAATLRRILTLKETEYETLEGLEQLRFIEAGIPIQLVQVDYQGRQGMTGIDSPEDVIRAERIIQQDGEFILAPLQPALSEKSAHD